MPVLAALAEAPNFTRVPPELSAHIGWLCLATLLLLLVWAASRMESVRRSFLALEDPRMFAVMRIGMALMTIQCFWNLKPYWRMLWSDEGLFSAEDARSRMGGSSLSGWTPEDGFLDNWAVGKFLWGKHSVFFLDASPDAVETFMYLFFGVCLLYALGVLSRVTGVLAWLMMSSVYNHNALYLEGTDTVYRTFWFILLFCRTGAAWSVDNVVRCWWLRRRGKLQEVGNPPQPGQKPVYKLVPSWPRYLMMGQLIAIYTSTGMVKTGSVWANGDALYYSLNLDHFYRFEGWTQVVSAAFGTTVFRLMTWVTLWWECCFAIAGLGMILKFHLDHRDQPWYRDRARWRVWLGRIALLPAYALLHRIVVLAYPYCIEIPKDATPEATAKLIADGLQTINIGFLAVIPAFTVLWFVLGRWPLRLRTRLRVLPSRTSGPDQPREATIDQHWLRKYFFGRRLWLGLGLMFHGFLILFMNIGMFPFIMLMTYAAWLTGEEFAAALRWLIGLVWRSPLGRKLPARWLLTADRWTGPAQAPAQVPQRGRPIPDLLVLFLGLLGLAVVGAWIANRMEPSLKLELSTYAYAWLLLCVVVGLVFRLLRVSPEKHLQRLGGGPALAYGPAGRAVALAFLVSHALVVGLGLGPNYSAFNTWRGAVRGLFGSWSSVTGTAQSWKMFAPNPPRANVFMKTVVVLDNGERWNIGNNAYDYRPFPWIWNDRIRKMHRRMVSKGKWYLRYWAHFYCREWYLETGTRAKSVEVHKLVTKIPTPDQVAAKGWYDPTKLKLTDELVETHACPREGDLPPFMKIRYGHPLTAEDESILADAAEREHKASETKRRTWASRRDWGGSGPPPAAPSMPSARTAPTAAAATAAADEDEPPAKDGGDGE